MLLLLLSAHLAIRGVLDDFYWITLSGPAGLAACD